MPDTYAQSHLPTTATKARHAADMSAMSKTQKYQSILQTHLFTPIAIKTSGVCNTQAREFIKELGKHITTVTGEEIDKLNLSANLSGNSERQHAVIHGVIHHRYVLVFQSLGLLHSQALT